jgi:hypothetical protein
MCVYLIITLAVNYVTRFYISRSTIEFSIAEATELSQTSCQDYVFRPMRRRRPLRNDTGISGFPFHQHLFDFTPLLELELVGKALHSATNPGQEGPTQTLP